MIKLRDKRPDVIFRFLYCLYSLKRDITNGGKDRPENILRPGLLCGIQGEYEQIS